MTIKELLDAANEGYPDLYLMNYYTETGDKDHSGSGDTLAEFIVGELIETYVADASDDEQIEEAIRVMERARHEIASVIQTLFRRGQDV